MSAGDPRLFAVQQETLTSDDFYTPAWIFERMGIEFELDVCAPPGGIPWIPARRHFTQEDDGLAQPWRGMVWMNPPFSAPDPWVKRFIRHGCGVALVPMSNGMWFHDLWGAADALTLPSARAFKFEQGGGIPIRVALAAFGGDCVNAIRRLGVVRRAA